MTDDQKLLRQYTEEHSEPAFGELVTRHIDFVYSVALRVVNGDSHLAKDITQTVFIDLARKANRLPQTVMLAGWLHRHACFTALTAIRTERRRQSREHTAMEMRVLDEKTTPAWEEIAPHLDECLNELDTPDREAIVLRFLKQQNFRALGETFGISEDAAQKRVTRALEKLRGLLGKRGVALPAVALTSVLGTQTTTAAPVGLATTVTAASLKAGTGTTVSILKLMAATKLKTAAVGTIFLVSVGTPLLMQRQAQAALRAQDDALGKQIEQITKLGKENERLSNLPAATNTTVSDTNNQFSEVLKLRGEIGRLQGEVTKLSRPRTNQSRSREDALAAMRLLYQNRVTFLKQQFETHPEESVAELRYLSDEQWMEMIKYDHALNSTNGYSEIMASTRSHAQIHFGHTILWPALHKYSKSNNNQFPTDISQLKPFFESPVDDAVLQNWTILPTSQLPKSFNISGPWVITQKPINRRFEQRFVMNAEMTQLGQYGDEQW